MKQKREEYIELGIEKSAEDIVLEVLGHGAGYTKGFGYGPKPPSRRNKLDNFSNQLQEELNDTKEKLEESEAQVHELKTQVDVLNANMATQGENMAAQEAKMAAQDAKIEKLMAFLIDKGMKL